MKAHAMATAATVSFTNLIYGTTGLMIGAALLLPLGASAQIVGSLSVTANDMTATASFVRNTPCTSYELEWGDGTTVVEEGSDGVCIEVLDEPVLEHTYEAAGTYAVTLTLNDETYTDEVTVPAEIVRFGLDEVASITSEWVDPSPQMADEEYYIHTITLEGGKVLEIEVAGFTTPEMRIEQFRAGGYTGDVDALLELVAEEVPADEPATEPGEDTQSLQQQLRTLIQELIDRLQALIAERTVS